MPPAGWTTAGLQEDAEPQIAFREHGKVDFCAFLRVGVVSLAAAVCRSGLMERLGGVVAAKPDETYENPMQDTLLPRMGNLSQHPKSWSSTWTFGTADWESRIARHMSD